MAEARLMEVRNLVKTFSSGKAGVVRAVNGVSLHIAHGETLALVGESGCGKTTLARAVAMLDPPTSGTVVFEGQEISALSRRQLKPVRRRIQMIFQDPYSSLNPRLPAGSIIAEPLVIHRLGNRAERRAEVERLARSVGLNAEDMDRYPHQFSGGQRQRIAIARALALKPTLIIADEPVSALDVSIRSQILNLLYDMREEYGAAFLFIGHDLAVVGHLADRVAVMYMGVIVEEGATESLFADPRHPYTQVLIAAAPRIGQGKGRGNDEANRFLSGDAPGVLNPPPGCPFHPRCPSAKEVCKQTMPELKPANGDARRLAACHLL
ncbi:MAG: hypothetical protein A3G18_13305 [Rhodospirillales bacterium RIFCSPLOWO2_12_FULL_58_28]|nr:MAG: hypothetical protein A3H92_13160 [Rhodospirillales bacterium RIFCSPLOWO2_02_FULL_58_16]OHC78555.1 MAG: hypothetical protein A3G18_13305 [Rhodospirillales bacterium RIFCSPLOWO2_12_FULL_58_28]